MVVGQRVGYVRVSSVDQNSSRQLETLHIDRVFSDTASGKDIHRPALAQMLDYLRSGDTLVVHSMDRLARNLDDLRRLVHLLISQGVVVEFVHEKLQFSGSMEAMPMLLLSVMGAFAEFERSLIRERQREGIALAKLRGVYKGRPRCLTQQQQATLRERVAGGEKKTSIARSLGVSRDTVYEYLR
jgi:DNA invertase Pin-like site-specific DNA recombinase